MQGEIQYISDIELIEKLWSLDALLRKNAQMSPASLFSGVISDVVQKMKTKVNFTSTGSTVKTVLEFLVPSVLFSIHPMLWASVTVAGEEGAETILPEAERILKSIVEKIKGPLLEGKKLTPADVNAASLQATASFEGDPLHELRKLANSGSLIKSADKKKLVSGVFKSLKGKSKLGLMAGFIGWFVKAVLLGAGLLAVGSGTRSLINNVESGKDTDQQDQQDQQDQPGQPGQQGQQGQPGHAREDKVYTNKLKPSTTGVKKFENTDKVQWHSPAPGGVQEMLISWATQVYPELSGYEDIISRTPSFKSTLREFPTLNGGYVRVPGVYTRVIDVVNKFAHNAYKDIQRGY